MANPNHHRDKQRARLWYSMQTSRSLLNLRQALANLHIEPTLLYEVEDPEWRGYKGNLKVPGTLIFHAAIQIDGRLALIHYTGKKTDGTSRYNPHSQAVNQARIAYTKRQGIPLLQLERRTPVEILEWQIKRFIRQQTEAHAQQPQ